MEVLKMIQQSKEVYVPFGRMTNMPFVICDDKTYNDQVWVFTQKVTADNFAKLREDQKIPVRVQEFENKQFLAFYSSLYAIGVNEVVFVNGDKMAKVPLKLILMPPDYSKIPEERRPVTNPQLGLSALYFLQEFRRNVPNEEKHNLMDLEEEMAANLHRATYMIAVLPDEKKEGGRPAVQVPTIQTQKGDVYQPVFTDPVEFNKFNKDNRFTAIKTDLQGLNKLLAKEAKGIAINPQGFNFIIMRDMLPKLIQRFA